MSIVASKRHESKLEVISYSIELRNMLRELMQRDFGIENLDAVVRRRYACGKEDIRDYAKYHYLLCNFKSRIDQTAALLTGNLRGANSIYPTTLAECDQRRELQNNALVDCEQLINELQQVVETFDVDINLYARYITAIGREIGLIKAWRQRDNKLRSRLQG